MPAPEHRASREKGRLVHGEGFLEEVGPEPILAGGRGLWTQQGKGTGGLGHLGPASTRALGPQARLLASVLDGKTECPIQSCENEMSSSG